MDARQPLLGTCTLVALASMPLILKLVDINGVYGFRTAVTVSDQKAWYKVNAFVGAVFLAAAAVSAALIYLVPSASRMVWSVIFFVVPMAIALAASFAYAGRLA